MLPKYKTNAIDSFGCASILSLEARESPYISSLVSFSSLQIPRLLHFHLITSDVFHVGGAFVP